MDGIEQEEELVRREKMCTIREEEEEEMGTSARKVAANVSTSGKIPNQTTTK